MEESHRSRIVRPQSLHMSVVPKHDAEQVFAKAVDRHTEEHIFALHALVPLHTDELASRSNADADIARGAVALSDCVAP
jgi:hypothetical protein